MADAGPAPKLPFGKQFSPAQTPLEDLVELVVQHAGDREALEQAIRDKFFCESSQQQTMGMNTFLAARAYGLLTGDEDYEPTPLANELSGLPDDAERHRRFALHLLTDGAVHGLAVLQLARSLRDVGTTPTRQALADALHAAGIDPGGQRGENIGALRQWLEAAGVVKSTQWAIDEDALEELLGPSVADLEALIALPLDHRAFLRALASVEGDPPYNSQVIAETADLQSRTLLKKSRNLPKGVLTPLQEAGWLTAEKTTTGQGAKPYLVRPTQKFLDEVKGPLADALVEQVSVAEPAMLRKPLAELLQVVRTEGETYERGIALEGVAIAILRLMGARFRTWRKNPSETGQAEVDLTADFVNGRYHVLQIQCKVSAIKAREVIDREVGVMLTVLANTILFISAKEIGQAARRAADEYMRINAVAIIFLDGDDLDKLAAGGSIADPLGREFRHVERVKTQASSAL